MAKTKKRQFGDLGEDVVGKYLENKGFEILDRNYLRPWGEIDIVAKKDGRLHFVEVKTISRESRDRGYRAEDNMHPRKIQRLHRAIQTYLLQKRVGEEVLWQLDLACAVLDLNTRRAKVEILSNITL